MLDYIEHYYIHEKAKDDFQEPWNTEPLNVLEDKITKEIQQQGIKSFVDLFIYYDITEKEDGSLICEKTLSYVADSLDIYEASYTIPIVFKDGHLIIEAPQDHEKKFSCCLQINAYFKETNSYDFRNVLADFHVIDIAKKVNQFGLKIDIYNVIDDDNYEDCIQYEQHTLKEITDMLAEINLKRNFKYF